MRIDLSQFNRNSHFYDEINLLLTIKSFDLQAIRKRYLASKKNQRSGSVDRRKLASGGIAAVSLKNGEVLKESILSVLQEPRGIDFKDGNLAISSENKAYILSNKIHEIKNDWFSYIHTVEFSPFNNDHLLISSSGYDCLFEYNWKQKKCEWEWFAWDHGICETKDIKTNSKLYLTRDREQFERWTKNGQNSLLINDPLTQFLPTAKRAAFINSVSYHKHNKHLVLATLFHHGSVACINKHSGAISMLMNGLSHPHGGYASDDMIMVTSTSDGEVRINDDVFFFKNLPNKITDLINLEWLQNSKKIDDFIITIDSNRTSFVIFHPVKKLYDMIPYNSNWAVQDMVQAELCQSKLELLKSLSLPT